MSPSQAQPRILNEAATAIIKGVYASTEDPRNPDRPILDRHRALTDIARTVTIVGQLLGGLSDKYFAAGKKYASLFATAGQIMWGIVEVSVPNSLSYRFMTHWLKLLVAFSVLMVAIGAIFKVPSLAPLGLEILAGVVVLWIVREILRKFMFTATWPRKTIATLLVAIGTALVLYLVVAHGPKIADWVLWISHLPDYFDR